MRALPAPGRRRAAWSVIAGAIAIQAGAFALYLYLFALAFRNVTF
ncbi:MAG: hypothetical protein ACLQK4_08735 [Acidimicrobiales bacterium]